MIFQQDCMLKQVWDQIYHQDHHHIKTYINRI